LTSKSLYLKLINVNRNIPPFIFISIFILMKNYILNKIGTAIMFCKEKVETKHYPISFAKRLFWEKKRFPLPSITDYRICW